MATFLHCSFRIATSCVVQLWLLFLCVVFNMSAIVSKQIAKRQLQLSNYWIGGADHCGYMMCLFCGSIVYLVRYSYLGKNFLPFANPT